MDDQNNSDGKGKEPMNMTSGPVDANDAMDANDANGAIDANDANDANEAIDAIEHTEGDEEHSCDFLGFAVWRYLDRFREPRYALAVLVAAASIQGFICLGELFSF